MPSSALQEIVEYRGVEGLVAAEVLTVPKQAIGRMIYESKLYLETTELFAWTLTVILLSFFIERLLLRLVLLPGNGSDLSNQL